MCFRPGTSGKKVKCPSCGHMNPQTLKKCVKCKKELQEDK